MKSGMSLISVVAIPPLVVAMQTTVHTAVAIAQDKPSATGGM